MTSIHYVIPHCDQRVGMYRGETPTDVSCLVRKTPSIAFPSILTNGNKWHHNIELFMFTIHRTFLACLIVASIYILLCAVMGHLKFTIEFWPRHYFQCKGIVPHNFQPLHWIYDRGDTPACWEMYSRVKSIALWCSCYWVSWEIRIWK